MNGDIVINLERQRFKGNVLDIGVNNYGIVYNICNVSKSNLQVDYLETGKGEIDEVFYHSCVMFLSMSNILLDKNKIKIFNMISKHLTSDGRLYIWDIPKKRGEIIDVSIKVVLPYRKIKTIKYKDYNPMTRISRQSLERLLDKNFEVIASKDINGLLYIEAQKRGRDINEENESVTCRDKF